MSDTTKIKTEIEPYVRQWLSKQFTGHAFTEKPVQLTTGESYAFDAVTDDRSIIAAILCNRAKTRTGRENTGGVRKALAEIGHLKLIPEGAQKFMIFTNDAFCRLIQRRANRLGIESIQMVVCKLPPSLEALLEVILDKASYEQRASE